MGVHEGPPVPGGVELNAASPEARPIAVRRSRKGGPRKALVESQLLNHAAELFAARGFDGTSLQDIADAAGVGRTTLYHYFKSKDDFLTALVEDVAVEASHRLSSIRMRPDLPPSALLKEAAEMLVRRAVERPGRFRVLYREENNLPAEIYRRHQDAKAAALAEIVAIINAGIAAGEFVSADPEIAALGIIGMCNWTAWWVNSSARESADKVVEVVADLAVNGLLRRVAPGADNSIAAAFASIRETLGYLERAAAQGRSFPTSISARSRARPPKP